jgi:ribonuclease HII
MDQENALYSQGFKQIAGTDEVGRGCLAGPVVAAALILPRYANHLNSLQGVRDSKMLSAHKREKLYESILEVASCVSFGIVEAEEIDRINILEATRKAMQIAILKLNGNPDALLIDAVKLPDVSIKQISIIKGDALCLSIAAASIVAKVTRDRMMEMYHNQYPDYGFLSHKGYGTRQHLIALSRYGITPLHRKTFAPVRALIMNTQDILIPTQI